MLVGLPEIKSLLISVIIYGAFLEEILKFLVVLLLIKKYKLPVYSVILVGLTFGIGEQIIHIYNGNSILLASFFMHLGSGVASWWYFSKKQIRNALIAPVVVHGVYNIGVWLVLWFWLIFVLP